jgi:hypothetical protein
MGRRLIAEGVVARSSRPSRRERNTMIASAATSTHAIAVVVSRWVVRDIPSLAKPCPRSVGPAVAMIT